MTPTTEELQAVLLHADYMEPISEALARNIRLLAQAELSRRESEPVKSVGELYWWCPECQRKLMG